MKSVIITSNLFFLSILLNVTTYAQIGQLLLGQQTDLSIIEISFPDTVQIGETAVLEGYIKNESNYVFNSNILLNYDIEDIEPEDYEEDEETDEEEVLENVQLQPGESIAFSRSIQIDPTRFISNTQDVVIVWPEIHRIVDSNTSNNYSINTVFVKEAALANEEDDDDDEDDEEEEDDDEDEDEEENERNNSQLISNKEGKVIQLNKNEKNSSFKAEQTTIQITQQNKNLIIEANNPDIEVLSFSLFTSNGQLVFTGKTQEYRIKNKIDIHPLISVINYQLKSMPNNVNTFTKSIITN